MLRAEESKHSAMNSTWRVRPELSKRRRTITKRRTALFGDTSAIEHAHGRVQNRCRGAATDIRNAEVEVVTAKLRSQIREGEFAKPSKTRSGAKISLRGFGFAALASWLQLHGFGSAASASRLRLDSFHYFDFAVSF